jgi:predicted MFS family arabinose efflux permease
MKPLEASPPQGAPGRPWPPLHRNRDYMLLWSGQVVSVIGTGASHIVYPLLVLSLTRSPAAAGIAAALLSFPYIIFSLPAGALIDRWDRKRVMILCDLGRALTLVSIPVALALDALTIWQIYLSSLAEGTLFVFYNLAEVASLPRVVPSEQLPEATAQNESAFAAATIIAPSIGTFLYQTLGRAAPFLVDSASYLFSVVSLAFIRAPLQRERAEARRPLRVEIREGLSWLWHQPLIRYMAFLTGASNFGASASMLILIVLAKRTGATDFQIGLVFSIGGLGGIAGSLVGGRIQRRFTFGQVIIAATWVWALLFPLNLLAPNVVVLGVITALMWLISPIYNVVQFSYRMALIPDQLQGRVNSTFRLLAFGFKPLGAALSGALLQWSGPAVAVGFFSAWYLGLALLTSANPHVLHARALGPRRPDPLVE